MVHDYANKCLLLIYRLYQISISYPDTGAYCSGFILEWTTRLDTSSRDFILEWTTSLDTSSRTLFVREGGRMSAHVTSNVELRNYVRLLLNVELRNYVISRQIVERRVT